MKYRLFAVLAAVCLGCAATIPAMAAYPDVPKDSWYCFAAEQVVQSGWLHIAEDGLFRPEDPLLRKDAMLALWQMRGCPTDVKTVPFSDVAPDAPYADAVAWASGYYIALGFPDGTFRPEDPLTRLQMACFLFRYNKWCGTGAGGGVWTNGLPFSDTDGITGDLETALAWCNLVGIMSGYADGAFQPHTSISRAQGAAALLRTWEWLHPKPGSLTSGTDVIS